MSAMLVRIKQKRTLPNGTKGSNIDMGDKTTIPFREDENGDHVAMVSNPRHIQRLLSITEGFEIHVANEPTAESVTVTPAQAPETVPEMIAAVTTPPPSHPAPEAAGGTLEEQSDDQIRAVYEAELQRKPHHNAKRETMLAQIEATRAESATKG